MTVQTEIEKTEVARYGTTDSHIEWQWSTEIATGEKRRKFL